MIWLGQSRAALTFYDISDKAAPAALSSLSQDGSLLSSRLLGGRLYFVSNYYVGYSDGAEPLDFVPRTYDNGAVTPLAAEDIAVIPEGESASYAVVCEYDLSSGTLLRSMSVLGAGSTVYMNGENLYLAGSFGGEEASEPRREGVYTVTDYEYESRTRITRIDLSTLSAEASGEVPGALDSNYAMDEYEGVLRLATTSLSYSYSVYEDEAMGSRNHIWDEGERIQSGLFMLDSGLNIIGSARDIAPGETVYSVRFDGRIGYVCTFEQVDPLFAFDLSDPAAPAKLSELKITGFSEYLHPWGEGRLLGLGYAATDEGLVTGLKLVMFDTADKADVTARAALELPYDYSPALYDAHAVFVDAERGLIGFPADAGYAVCSYSEEDGFAQVLFAEGQGTSDCRGLRAGKEFYVVSAVGLQVISLDDFSVIANVRTR